MVLIQNRFAVLEDLEDRPTDNTTTRTTDNASSKIRIRTFFKLIQNTHHTEIINGCLEGNTFPPGMYRKANKLTNFVKPAHPTQNTLKKVEQNTQSWMGQNMLILHDHYRDVLCSLLTSLDSFNDGDFSTAQTWAKNRFGRKLKSTTIEKTREMILIKLEQRQRAQDPVHCGNTFLQVDLYSSVCAGAPAVCGEEGAVPLEALQPTSGMAKTIDIEAQVIHSEQSQITPPPVQPQPLSPLANTTSNVAVDVSFEILNTSMSQGSGPLTPPAPTIPPPALEREREHEMMKGTTEDIIIPEKTLSELSLSLPLEEATNSSPLGYRPTRHPNTSRKYTGWSITITKPIVFIGDSNLSRIPNFTHPDIQIDSYPGAKFIHIDKILQKLDPDPHTQKLIISAGINNREQHPTRTAMKQLQGLWRTAKIKFPNASIYTVVINFSDRLPKEEKENLKVLNEYILSRGNPLQDLHRLRFRVDGTDLIHWTEGTAKKLFMYWLQQLNLE